MKNYPSHLTFGLSISKCCANMVEEAKQVNDSVRCDFNDVELIAHPDTNPIELAAHYRFESEKRQKAYEDSDECKESQKKRNTQITQKQIELNSALVELYQVTGDEELLTLLAEIQPLTDDVSVTVPVGDIVNFLNEQGYSESMNTGEAFKKEDRANFTGYIAGQVISMLNSMGAIHPVVVVVRFVKEWETQFK